MELVLTLPVLGVLLLGVFEFTCLFITWGSVVEASRSVACLGTPDGVIAQEHYQLVRQSLGADLTEVADVQLDTDGVSGETVICEVRVPMSACAPNLLWPIGFDLNGRYLECRTRSANGSPAAAQAEPVPPRAG